MRIIRPYLPGHREEDQTPSREAAKNLRLWRHYRVVSEINTLDPIAGYESFLMNILDGTDDIIIFEHDIVPRLSDTYSLEFCPHPCCVGAHYLYPVSAGVEHPIVAHRKWVGNKIEWIGHQEEWADIISLGIIKISKEVQQAIDWNGFLTGEWNNVDIRMSDRLRGALEELGVRNQFHVHWPIVEHRHWR